MNLSFDAANAVRLGESERHCYANSINLQDKRLCREDAGPGAMACAYEPEMHQRGVW